MIPLDAIDKKVLSICGSKSGRHLDKIQESGLTLVNSDEISVPGIKECALTLECKVIYEQAQTPLTMTEANKKRFHPQDVDVTHSGSNKDYHTAFYGEIVKAYIIE